MAQTEAARAEAFAKQADRSRELAAGYVQQALENANAIRKTKALFDNALATIGIQHRWVGTTLELLNPVSGVWVSGPDLRGTDGVDVESAEIIENGHLIITLSNTEVIDAGVAYTGGDFIGPGSSTDGNPIVFDGLTGKLGREVTFAAFKAALALAKADVGLGNVDNTSNETERAAAAALTNKTIDATLNTISKLALSMFASGVIDADGTLAANSDLKLATQKAVKTYADGLIEAANALQYKGTIACAANPNYPAASAGHMYIVSSAGKIGGASGLDVEIGDALICKADSTAAGTQSSVGAQWTILQFNLVGALTSANIGSTVQAHSAVLAALAAGVTLVSGVLSVSGSNAAGSSIRLFEDTDSGTNYVGLKAPDALGANIVFTLPSADGAEGHALKTNGSGGLIFGPNSGSFGEALLHVADEKTVGTSGQTPVASTWNIRNLNTVRVNEIAGASLSSSQITLPAGTYYIQASAPAARADRHRIRLYNVTDGLAVMYGPNTFAYSAQESFTHAFLNGRFTLAATKTLRLEHFTQSTQLLGYVSSSGAPEIYSDVQIWKVG